MSLHTILTNNTRMSAKDLDDRNSSKIEAGSGGEAEEEVSLSLWREDRVMCSVH